MKVTFEENNKQNKENLRIEHLPLLKYTIKQENGLRDNKIYIESKQFDNASSKIDFNLKIKNIGRDGIRKIYIKIIGDIVKNSDIFEFCGYSVLEKDEEKENEIIIEPVSKGKYYLEIYIYYQDLLQNWYEQKIELEVKVTNTFEVNNFNINILNYKILDENLLPNNSKKIKNLKTINKKEVK